MGREYYDVDVDFLTHEFRRNLGTKLYSMEALLLRDRVEIMFYLSPEPLSGFHLRDITSSLSIQWENNKYMINANFRLPCAPYKNIVREAWEEAKEYFKEDTIFTLRDSYVASPGGKDADYMPHIIVRTFVYKPDDVYDAVDHLAEGIQSYYEGVKR